MATVIVEECGIWVDFRIGIWRIEFGVSVGWMGLYWVNAFMAHSRGMGPEVDSITDFGIGLPILDAYARIWRPVRGYTCSACDGTNFGPQCGNAWDPYNHDGNCLAKKKGRQ